MIIRRDSLAFGQRVRRDKVWHLHYIWKVMYLLHQLSHECYASLLEEEGPSKFDDHISSTAALHTNSLPDNAYK